MSITNVPNRSIIIFIAKRLFPFITWYGTVFSYLYIVYWQWFEQNQLLDGRVVQLFADNYKSFIGINDDGKLTICVKDGEDTKTHFVVSDRGLGVYSLSAHKRPNFRLSVKNGILDVTNGAVEQEITAPEQDEDFYIKERPNGLVHFDSVVSPAGYGGQQFLSFLFVLFVTSC